MQAKHVLRKVGRQKDGRACWELYISEPGLTMKEVWRSGNVTDLQSCVNMKKAPS